MGEIENIKKRYKIREQRLKPPTKGDFYFSYLAQCERQLVYSEMIKNHFDKPYNKLKFIEIGAGSGTNLYFFCWLGISLPNIFANELIEDRWLKLKENFPTITIYPGDASELPFENEFDIVLQSTVFTSILDDSLRQKVASKMFLMTKQNGMILWYDFIFNNPMNDHVKGIKIHEIRTLFPDARKIVFKKVTLAPPIARRINKQYWIINKLFPFFRTHVVAAIYK